MFEEYEHVKIKDRNLTGIIIDKRVTNGVAWYVVEDDVPGRDNEGFVEWPLYDCTDADLVRIPEDQVS